MVGAPDGPAQGTPVAEVAPLSSVATDLRSARRVAEDIRRRRVSPIEVLEACLERVDRWNPQLQAVIWRNDDEARQAARQATDAVMHRPEQLGPFHGVPIPIKDLTRVNGWPTTYGSAAAPDAPSAESELVVDAFVRAGFILTGRTNTPEFGPLTAAENDRYGLTRNPWDLGRTPGGSSGGASSATAAGLFPLAHGNDGGGSIRIPASCCGLVGLKVSRGRVPARFTWWEGAAVEGVVTNDVADTAAVLDVISGVDAGCWYNAPAPSRPFSDEVGADPGRLRVGLVTAAPLGLPVDTACVAAAEAACRMLQALGHAVEPAVFEVPDAVLSHYLKMVNGGLADFDGIDWERAEPHIQTARRAALEVDSLSYIRAVHELQRFSRGFTARWGREFDLLVTPTMAIEPPEVGTVLHAAHDSRGELMLPVVQMAIFTSMFNVTGLPAISLPLHVAPSGLPVGVQLVGGPWGEAQLLRVAGQLERAYPWAARHPPVG